MRAPFLLAPLALLAACAAPDRSPTVVAVPDAAEARPGETVRVDLVANDTLRPGAHEQAELWAYLTADVPHERPRVDGRGVPGTLDVTAPDEPGTYTYAYTLYNGDRTATYAADFRLEEAEGTLTLTVAP